MGSAGAANPARRVLRQRCAAMGKVMACAMVVLGFALPAAAVRAVSDETGRN